jgi:multiple sugar transport system permease protein
MALAQELQIPIARARRPLRHHLERESVLGYLLIAPAVLYILALVAYPFFLALWFSLSNATVGRPDAEFVGLDNFKWAVDSDVFKTALKNTFIFTIVGELAKALFGTLLALLLVREFKGKRLARGLILVPWAIPIAVGSIAWKWMFDSTYSVINWVLVHLHLVAAPGPNWLGEIQWAMASIILVNVWRGLPFTAIIVLAGLTSIPQEILDAAKVDGAGPWRRWNDVMVPVMAPVLFIAMLFSVVFTFTDMTVVYLLTKGGPGNLTHVLASFAFQTGILSAALGRGAAISLFLFPVMLAGALWLLNLLKRQELGL